MNALIALMRKDLVLYFSNRRALITSIAAPILIASFFGYLFDSGGRGPTRVPIAVADLDNSPISQKILAGLKADPALAVQNATAESELDLVKHAKVRASVVLPAGFGAAATRALFRPGDKPTVLLHFDPSQAMALAMVRGLLTQHVMQAIIDSMISLSPAGTSGTVLDEAKTNVLADTALPEARKHDLLAMLDSIRKVGAAPAPTPAAAEASSPGANAPHFSMPFNEQTVEVTANPNSKYNSYAHSFAGMSVQFILFGGIELGVGVLLARRMGLWKRLRAAPISRALLLGSRIASGAVIALILLLIIFAAGMLMFGFRIDGSVPGFLGICIAFALLTASFGLLIAAIGKTPEATRGLAILATLMLVMLGGAWVPTFVFPEWLQTAGLFVPTRWAIDGFDAMTWRGLGFDTVLLPIAVMLGFSAAFSAIAIWRFDWEE
jgi:ABC-2 type transport system permease protein